MGRETEFKWDRIHANRKLSSPARVLCENSHLLPSVGKALDAACGLGANALMMASKGLSVDAWDCSRVAIDKLRQEALERGVRINVQVRDVVETPWPEAVFDVIVISRFLVRSLCPAIHSALKPGGMLFYQTFTVEKTAAVGPSNPDYLLKENELLRLFPELTVCAYREEGRCGNFETGLRNEAYLVGKKPVEKRND